MFSTRPAAEIEPDRAISSSTATLPGPIRAPEARSSRMLSRSAGFGAGVADRFAIAQQQTTQPAADQSGPRVAELARRRLPPTARAHQIQNSSTQQNPEAAAARAVPAATVARRTPPIQRPA